MHSTALNANVLPLLSQACEELLSQLRAGQDADAGQMLSRYPQLAEDHAAAAELIATEFLFRREAGQHPSADSYLTRYRVWKAALRRRLWEAGAVTEEDPTVPARRNTPAPPRQRREPETAPLPALGAYERIEVIGRGGMGVVYRAYDRALGRAVALKVLRGGALADDEERRRFCREAQAAARLRHPNIVPVLAFGSHQGEDCFTMPLYTGGTLAHRLNNGRLSAREAAQLLVVVARAIQAAHEAGVVHRDLKPSNILMEGDAPHVADFGASSLRGSDVITITGASLGTPAYMAPEQTRGSKVGPAADIWAMGAILYECLTGHRPFDGKTAEMLMEKVRAAAPQSPRARVPSVPVELEVITMRCLARLPSGRFASARELADDLERFLNGEPVRSKPPRNGAALAFPLFSLGAMAAVLSGVLLFSVPPTEPPKPPSPEGELVAGRPWTFVGPVGMPTGYRWRIDDGRRPLPVRADVPLSFSAWSPTQMELLPSVPVKSYHFRAEVALVGGMGDGSAGIYVMGEEGTFGNRPTFSGYYFMLRAVEGKRVEGQGVQMKGERPQLGRFFYMPSGTRKGEKVLNWGDTPALHNDYLAANVTALGANPACRLTLPLLSPRPRGAWHRLELEVTPTLVRAYLDGIPVGQWSQTNTAARKAAWWRAVRMFTKGLPPTPPDFPVQGGLGLFADQASMVIRNVSVSPIP
jgi:serine/threonine protein kinase